MDFPTYAKQLPRGGRKLLALSLGIPPSYLSRLISGDRAITAERAIQIEHATDGKVSRQECLPTIQWKQAS